MAFNVLRMDGTHVGYAAVERACAAAGVHVRTGCCCNPGACDYFTSLPLAASRVDDDDDDDDDDGTVRKGGMRGRRRRDGSGSSRSPARASRRG